ncbi:MAG: hypothetical protein Q7T82_03290 [Armatimonadota bacterium]|nr:hypothetical protein [Armatimonadota bacterium]
MPDRDAQTIWLEVVEKVKNRTISPALWRALEKAAGVTIEGNSFIVGFHPADFPMRGHLASGEHKNAIDQAIRESSGKPLTMRLIEGTSVADWESAKKREVMAEATRQAAIQRKQEEGTASRTWEILMEKLSRKYAMLPLRQFPQTRARFLAEAAVVVADAMDQYCPRDGQVDEITERGLARLIEKIATLMEMPSTEVAMHVLRCRGELK